MPRRALSVAAKYLVVALAISAFGLHASLASADENARPRATAGGPIEPSTTRPTRVPAQKVPWTPRPESTPEHPRLPKRLKLTPKDIVHKIWIAAGYGWELSFVDAVVNCESKWNPNAVGGHGEAGLFQIHPVNFRLFNGQNPWDVRANTYVALAMRKSQGWSPWTCARRLGAGTAP